MDYKQITFIISSPADGLTNGNVKSRLGLQLSLRHPRDRHRVHRRISRCSRRLEFLVSGLHIWCKLQCWSIEVREAGIRTKKAACPISGSIHDRLVNPQNLKHINLGELDVN